MVGLVIVSPNPILIIIVVLGGLELWRRLRERGERAEYYALQMWQRAAVAVVYIGLIAVLAVAVSATHVARTFYCPTAGRSTRASTAASSSAPRSGSPATSR